MKYNKEFPVELLCFLIFLGFYFLFFFLCPGLFEGDVPGTFLTNQCGSKSSVSFMNCSQVLAGTEELDVEGEELEAEFF